MKKILMLLICIMFISGIAFNKHVSNKNILEDPIKLVKVFFSEFEESNFATMSNMCNQSCVENYFHENDVYGMKWSTLVDIGEVTYTRQKDECTISVQVEMETVKTSSQHGSSETDFVVVLKKSDDSWLIDSFVNGY